MIQLRLKREKREAMSSPSMLAGGGGHKPVVTFGALAIPNPRPSPSSPA